MPPTAINRRAGTALALAIGACALISGLLKHQDHLHELLRWGSDSLGYYQFLPAVLIDHDLGRMPWVHMLENGKGLSIFSVGVAYLQLPFFFLGHAWASASGAEANGYSAPYAVMQLVGAAAYLAAGCRLLYGVLALRTDARTALVTVALLYLATNLFYYGSFEAGMSHVYSFFLFAALLALTERWMRMPGPETLIALLVTGALIILVRPLNAVALLLPVLYRTSGITAVLARWRPVLAMGPALALGALFVAALVLPQLTYWHAITGKWVLFTYGTKQESFDFSAPHLFDLLVSHQNGWFIYTPLMAAVLLTLLWQARRPGTGARTVLVVWCITWYLYGCWWAWWLGGAFGYRGFIEYSAFLALPLSGVVGHAVALKPAPRRMATGIAALLVFMNLRLSIIYASPWDGPDWTWARFWEEIGRAFFLG